jgi:hypothetical protein
MNITPIFAASGFLKRILLGAAAVFAFSALVAPPVHAEEAYIVDVVRAGSPDRVMFSATLKGAMTKEIKESIESGAPVTFIYLVKLNKVRRVMWDETIREVAVKKLVKYDALRKVYLTWEKKGDSPETISFDAELLAAEYKDKEKENASTPSSPAKEPPQPPQEPTILKEREVTEKWMTHLENVDLGATADMRASGRHYVSVKCEMKAIKLIPPLNYILFFVSLWDFDTKWSDSSFFVINGSPEPPRKTE